MPDSPIRSYLRNTSVSSTYYLRISKLSTSTKLLPFSPKLLLSLQPAYFVSLVMRRTLLLSCFSLQNWFSVSFVITYILRCLLCFSETIKITSPSGTSVCQWIRPMKCIIFLILGLRFFFGDSIGISRRDDDLGDDPNKSVTPCFLHRLHFKAILQGVKHS